VAASKSSASKTKVFENAVAKGVTSHTLPKKALPLRTLLSKVLQVQNADDP
jgi:hypothetical protein